MDQSIEVSIKKVEIQKCIYDLFAKFGNDKDQKIAKRNLKKIEKALTKNEKG